MTAVVSSSFKQQRNNYITQMLCVIIFPEGQALWLPLFRLWQVSFSRGDQHKSFVGQKSSSQAPKDADFLPMREQSTMSCSALLLS